MYSSRLSRFSPSSFACLNLSEVFTARLHLPCVPPPLVVKTSRVLLREERGCNVRNQSGSFRLSIILFMALFVLLFESFKTCTLDSTCLVFPFHSLRLWLRANNGNIDWGFVAMHTKSLARYNIVFLHTQEASVLIHFGAYSFDGENTILFWNVYSPLSSLCLRTKQKVRDAAALPKTSHDGDRPAGFSAHGRSLPHSKDCSGIWVFPVRRFRLHNYPE